MMRAMPLRKRKGLMTAETLLLSLVVIMVANSVIITTTTAATTALSPQQPCKQHEVSEDQTYILCKYDRSEVNLKLKKKRKTRSRLVGPNDGNPLSRRRFRDRQNGRQIVSSSKVEETREINFKDRESNARKEKKNNNRKRNKGTPKNRRKKCKTNGKKNLNWKEKTSTKCKKKRKRGRRNKNRKVTVSSLKCHQSDQPEHYTCGSLKLSVNETPEPVTVACIPVWRSRVIARHETDS